MFCHKCGAQITEGSVFCHKCGTKVNITAGDTTEKNSSPDIDLTLTFKIDGFLDKVLKSRRRVFYVSIDGQRTANILYGESITQRITPGQHCVELRAEKGSEKPYIWLNVPVGNGPIQLSTQKVISETEEDTFLQEVDYLQLICAQKELVIPAPFDSLPELGGRPYCPNCHSQDVFPTTETETSVSGGGYGFGGGCCGWILFGPIGLLCGFCGRGVRSKSINRKFWLCRACGHKFRDAEDEYKEQQQLLAAMGWVSLFVAIIVPAILDYLSIYPFGLSPHVFQIIGALGLVGSFGGILYLAQQKTKK